MNIPADSVLLSGMVDCEEADLTGETGSIPKIPLTDENSKKGAECILLAKSVVASGQGRALVVGVGPNTVAGVITEKTRMENEPTPLQDKLEGIAYKIGNIGIACAVLTFMAMVVRITLEMTGVLPCGCQNIFNCEEVPGCVPYSFKLTFEGNRLWEELLQALIISITIIVVAIPEGLPLAVTISLSYSSAQMRKLNNLVRSLDSCETMGGATYICSDKTGTLTMNKMTVMAAYSVQQALSSGKLYTEQFYTKVGNRAREVRLDESNCLELILESVLWNTNARIEKTGPSYNVKGQATEQGLMKFMMDIHTPKQCFDLQRSLDQANVLRLDPFDSITKMSTLAVRMPHQEGTQQEVRIYCKGAPEVILDTSRFFLTRDGQRANLDDDSQPMPLEFMASTEAQFSTSQREIFLRGVSHYAKQAFRTILCSFKDMSLSEYNRLVQAGKPLNKDLTVISLFALMDPLKPSVPKSITTCRRAGIQVVMCTGDNLDTAKAIAVNSGILTQSDLEYMESKRQRLTIDPKAKYTCMTGQQFREEVGGLKWVPK
mmetsp:Transcript_27325/g.41551  ORF Transcript_27325/g.41551 Transcript_27325/m.41551 type:complete len:546 (+) Transcript_27325:1005-2642(+)